jgi:hypothetical protein
VDKGRATAATRTAVRGAERNARWSDRVTDILSVRELRAVKRRRRPIDFAR